MSGIYAANGAINVTVVSGSTLTGLYASNGSINVINATGHSGLLGVYHPCGALWVTPIVGSSSVGHYAANGSMNVCESPFSAKGAVRVNVVSGSLGGAKHTSTNWFFLILGD